MEDSNEIVHLAFQYSESEYISAARFYYRRFRHIGLRMAVSAFAVLVGMFGEAFYGDSGLWFALIFFGIILFALNTAIYFNNPRAHFRKHPFIRQRYEVEFSDDGIKFRTEETESKYKWGFYRRVIETSKHYYLLYEGNWFSLIPKRAFQTLAEEQKFRSLLKQHVDPRIDRDKIDGWTNKSEEYVPRSLEPPDWR